MPGLATSLFAPYRRTLRRGAPGSTTLPIPAAPSTPSTPSPADTATAYYTLLSWLAAGAARVDLYLDTVTPPVALAVPKFVGSSYVPTLLPATRYYWQVVAFNDGGSATGPIWSFTTPAASAMLFSLAGAIVTARARFGTLSIREVLGAAPNTGSLTFDTLAPTAGQGVKIGLGMLDNAALEFAGEIQATDETYVDTAGSRLWPVTLIDHTFRVNKRRPYGTWVMTSASAIARYLVTTFAPGFTANHVQDGLPAVSINFDGQQDFMTCMRALATAISTLTVLGHTKIDYSRDVHLFLTESDVTPDPLDATHPPLNNPSPIAFAVDHSQLRTRNLGKGHGEVTPTNVGLGEPILPIADAVMFTGTGGQAVIATTSGGAQAIRVTYESVQLGGGGAVVGPGAAPSVAPSSAVVIGAGLSLGTYGYAYTDVTAAGESLPSPIRTVVVGLMSGPATAPSPATPTTGAGPDDGTHVYATSFVTAAGETVPGPTSATVTTGTSGFIPNPTSSPVASNPTTGGNVPHQNWSYGYTWVNGSGETAISPLFSIDTTFLPGGTVALSSIAVGPAGTTSKNVYRFGDNGGNRYQLLASLANSTTSYSDTAANAAFPYTAVPPAANATGATADVVALTGIPIGPSGTTARKVYRTAAGGSQLKLVTTINDNTTTTYTDSTTDAGLGANALTTGTATANQVALSAIAPGPTNTTARNVYRTVVNAAQLKFLTTLADNTTTTYTDAIADGSLGANVPTGDTSGLTQPTGQVNAGSTTLLLASAGPFLANGGWAGISGGQTIRYTSVGGAFAPPAGPTGVLTAGGAMTPGVHGFAFTCITAAGESLPSPILYVTIDAVNGRVNLTMPVGPTGTLSRKFYLTEAGVDVLHNSGTVADNVTTAIGFSSLPDGTFNAGARPPTRDASGLDARTFLTGIPASGPGAITTTILYGSQVLPMPALVGVNHWNGVPVAIAKGSSVNIFVQRDDLAAQAALGASELDDNGNPTDGVREYTITDGTRGEASLIAVCDADLAQFSRPIVSATYYTRDKKTRAGRTVHINLPGFEVYAGDYTIQAVDITFDGPGLLPLRRVTASSVAFTLADLLRLTQLTTT